MLRFRLLPFLFMLILSPHLVSAAGPDLPHEGSPIDHLVNEAVASGLIAGGVVLVGDAEETLLLNGYGRLSPDPVSGPMTTDAIFDLASLTKVLATTPSILKLAEQRKLSLVDPLVKWFPEFAGKGKDDLLVLNLLTHTSGLDDFPLSASHPLQSAIAGAAAQPLRGEIGSRFRYADINFILLGELVRRVSGKPLEQYTEESFYGPLRMLDTGFGMKGLPDRYSPTAGDGGALFRGVPQDLLCRQLGGVAGHAGLFGTAEDLARFARMILNGGEAGGVRVLSERAVQQMTVPYFSRGGDIARGLGWDIASPFSAPKGALFSAASFGHTGYSGTSVWIDPELKLYVIFLSVRTNYRDTAGFRRLRSGISSSAVGFFGQKTGSGKRPDMQLQAESRQGK